ncbi:hypothetical protein [Sphingomonas mucosissima]|uniref:Uncharacterized protein n=1 Tax=Sphingomonas mucosissima TaxID=370959 RepID=A0A245ZRD0_9SPHN|nr:hypothetical protein [Sphingomonas mucosissima]OWK32296.1 hypothetical protein SPMU_06180 [Sphingomonas mucosissima]
MATNNPAKVAGVPTRDFNDSGTTQRFAKGKTYNFEPGAFRNYEAAGLVKKAADKPAS